MSEATKATDFTADLTGEVRRIVLRPPGPDAPGYWRRLFDLDAAEKRLFSGDLSAARDIWTLMAPFIVEPTDPESQLEAFMSLSKAQWQALYAVFIGSGNDAKN